MGLVPHQPLNRWTWTGDRYAYRTPPSVYITQAVNDQQMFLKFTKEDESLTVQMSKREVQSFIDALQEIIGVREDSHIAFPEVTEEGIGLEGPSHDRLNYRT